MRLLLVCFLLVSASALARDLEGGGGLGVEPAATRLDLYCLRLSYPSVTGLVEDAQGQWLLLENGQRVLYARAWDAPAPAGPEAAWVVDVRTSMADIYPLEPERPDTPLGFSPGRRRSHDLLQALYGHSPATVGEGLEQAFLLGRPVHLSRQAAQAMRRADASLREMIALQPELVPLLVIDGGFTWRRIAGEQRLSPHAFGIAFDISPHLATYWRWNPLRPHPMQKIYPSAIVEAFEREGFIWGGKWHEYDLMHFEYRPELVCKARTLRDMRAMTPQAKEGVEQKSIK
ncbi:MULTISPECIES: M15 family metallopeptidase [unclassified Desulfovibrio]|uniref:M15 family metallopeptidase n=1 Tax=unclassified Desulfovibrio TaxID=2593640 RepID=UPI000F5E5A90|nr:MULTISPECIES: M15 family metallopeptidase [unclassified Desulfovibrio]RRD69945.1 M15 family peptidase [Desulfovibrio sp. OH1209_COT-279]RRD86513.1 M15 family peptidase [Desulfovibrio sp. OH1186_COT-070]